MHALTVRPARLTTILAVVLILTALITGCIAGNDDGDADHTTEAAPPALPNLSGGTVGAEPEYDADGEERSGAAAEAAGDDTVYAPNYVASQMPLDRMIIRTVMLDLTVEDVGQGVIWVRDLAARKGGFVFSSNTYERADSQFAEITIRVPADELEATMQELREHQLVVRVDREESTSKDVSQEYLDNEARLSALEETYRRFMALLSEADSVDEILMIEAELTNIRSQIETIKGRQNYLDQMTAFSTITVTLSVEGEQTLVADAEKNENFIARIFRDAWGSASGVIEDLLTGTITVAIIGLAALPFVLLLYFAGKFIYRRVRAMVAQPQVAVVTAPVVEENS